MKRTILLFVFAIATAVSAQAQMQTTKFGVRVGANYAGLSGSDADNADRVWRAHAGITANIPLSIDNFFSLQPELLFSMKGAESLGNISRVRVNYLDVPVLARINAGPLYFEGGPQVSVRISGDVEGNAMADTDANAFSRATFGYAAGVGIAATQGISIGVRYNGDVSRLYDEDNRPNYRNSVFMLTLGFMFPGR